MQVLNISTYPYNDPDARWSCRMEDGQLLLIIGSDQDRICLALTPTDTRTLLEHVQDFLAQVAETAIRLSQATTCAPGPA